MNLTVWVSRAWARLTARGYVRERFHDATLYAYVMRGRDARPMLIVEADADDGCVYRFSMSVDGDLSRRVNDVADGMARVRADASRDLEQYRTCVTFVAWKTLHRALSREEKAMFRKYVETT